MVDVMNIHTYPAKKEEIYNKHLNTIRDKTFTVREIDVMSCMLHNRKQQKIASLLSITPKTVNAHLYNVVNKLGHNSINVIIDFIERSGKLYHFREYYFHLVVQSLFNQYLKKIGVINRHANIVCNVICNEIGREKFLKLESYLKSANIELIFYNPESDLHQQDYEPDNIYNVHISAEKSSVIPVTAKGKGDVILLFREVTGKSDKYIDFTQPELFYDSVFKLLKIITANQDIAKLIKEYNDEYLLLQQGWKEMLHIPENGESYSSNLGNNKRLFAYAGLVVLLIGGVFYFLFSPIYQKKHIQALNKECHEFIEQYSFGNIGVTEGLKGNLNLLKNMDEALSSLNHHQVKNYLINSSTKEVINYLYSVRAVSMHLLYNEYDAVKPRKMLLLAKEIMESYINSRSNVKINFEECDKEESFAEIAVIEGFPEIYSQILYLLGRTYTYFEEVGIGESKVDQMQYEEYENYYKTAAYIGSKSKIFEGYLSQRNLIEMVNLLKISRLYKNIEDDNREEVVVNIYKIIKELEKLKSDNTEYILNYRPGVIKHETIIPSVDNYNKLYLTERILHHYTRLFKIEDSKDRMAGYINEISLYFSGAGSNNSVFDELQGVPSKKIACFYNTIGFMLLQLVDVDINADELYNRVTQKMHLAANNKMEQIIEVFQLAKAKSRNSHYPKLHSYKGLMQVYQQLLNQDGLKEKNREEITAKIAEYTKKIENLEKRIKQNL